VKRNKITGYQVGIKIFNSSAELGGNTVINDNINGTKTSALLCDNLSLIRCAPVSYNNNYFWTGGKNTFISSRTGDGVRCSNMSIPDIDYGNNTISGFRYNFSGLFKKINHLSMRNNCWMENPPSIHKFSLNGIPFDLSGSSCTQSTSPKTEKTVDLGNGIYDTVDVTASAMLLNPDKDMYFGGVSKIMENDFTGAINIFKNHIQLYGDSISALFCLNNILYCAARQNLASYSYTSLRDYYNQLAQNSQDTLLSVCSRELSRKCLIKRGLLEDAIYEY
jgi:hypothetical protein